MSTSILEQIAVLIAAKLATVTVDEGYEITVSDVARPTLNGGYVPADKLAILTTGDSDRAEEEETYDLVSWRQEFFAVILLRQAEAATEAVDTLIHAALASVQKALMSDPQWSLLAIDTDLIPPLMFDPIGHLGFDGVAVGISVLYRVKRDDPYTQ